MKNGRIGMLENRIKLNNVIFYLNNIGIDFDVRYITFCVCTYVRQKKKKACGTENSTTIIAIRSANIPTPSIDKLVFVLSELL